MDQLFFITPSFAMMLVRLAVSTLVTWFIIDKLYYPKSKRRDFYFTFMLISVAIFFIVFFMIFVLDNMKGKTSMGIGIGLFGIFSIMRYRTDAMPVREMTYLFVIIALSLVNSIAEGVSIVELLLTNLIIVVFVWLLERNLKLEASRLIQYDRVDLIAPEKRDELKADLEKGLGVKIIKVDVGAVDFIRDMAMVKIIYQGKHVDREISENFKIK
jgi:Ca2+/Na+ antiporter